MTLSRTLRLHLPVLVLAAMTPLLALRFGGYHVRTFGWVSLALVLWACVQAARGRASAPRSIAGAATFGLVALTVWSGASIAWADSSRHDAWVETARTAGYAAALLLGGTLLANARSFARYATLSGIAIALVGIVTLVRIITATAPLKSFVAGRLDWPIGYAPALAALYLIGMLLLLGVACATERTWYAGRAPGQVALGGIALAGAGVCAALAYAGQTRGTLPALLVAVVAALVVTPFRLAWFLRFLTIALGIVAVRGPLGALFQTQFALRQAPFTKGADADQLLLTAQDAATHAAFVIVGLAVALGLVGAALVPLGIWLADAYARVTGRVGRRALLATVVLVTALVATLGLAASHRSPTSWAKSQYDSCVHPVEAPNDPGSSVSHFANSGTGRCDYYRVALVAFRAHPLLGLGAGNFRGEYVRERTTEEEPRQAHSLPLALLAELGLVGAALGALVLGAVLVATSRFVRSGPARDPAFAGAIAAMAYWVAHASIDWLWQVPAVSLVPVVLAGGLVACVSPGQQRVKAAVAGPIAVGVVLVSLALVLPVTLADAKLRSARDPHLQEQHPKQALEAAVDA
ncbi:MAG: hypothetical protein JWN72_1518, partial [Thermoleophilia bacterium]|nr:hypothetical protein [Thermoleophilia bacterium]